MLPQESSRSAVPALGIDVQKVITHDSDPVQSVLAFLRRHPTDLIVLVTPPVSGTRPLVVALRSATDRPAIRPDDPVYPAWRRRLCLSARWGRVIAQHPDSHRADTACSPLLPRRSACCATGNVQPGPAPRCSSACLETFRSPGAPPVARGVGGRRSARHRNTRGSPVDSRSAWVTRCPGIGDTLFGEGRAAHGGSAWQRPTTEQTKDEGCGCCGGWARGCSRVLRNGQAAHHWAGTRGQRASAGEPPPRGRPCATSGGAITGQSAPTGTGRA
jgi:hypothetical protein